MGTWDRDEPEPLWFLFVELVLIFGFLFGLLTLPLWFFVR